VRAGWAIKPLSEVCTLQRGFDLPTQVRIPGDFPLVSASGIIDTHNEGPVAGPGVVTGRSGSIGSVFFVENDFWPLNTALYVRDFHGNDPRFVWHLLNHFDLKRFAGGTGVPTLNRNDVHGELVNIPATIDEQHRIVAILDEAFDGIATAKANAEQNLQNARALFESHLQQVFTERGEGWVDRTLDNVCIVERGSSPRPIKNFFTTAADGVNWIKIGDTEEGGKYIFCTGQKITPEGAKQSRYVKEGDFILTNSMSLGRPYIMKTDGYIHDGWFVLRLGERIDPEFFYYLLSSSYVQGQFHSLAAGAIVKNISGDLVKKAVLPIPPLSQQLSLAERFVEFSDETQHLESLYQQKVAALDELKKSLLHQAFSGAL
jgi:type I restriction enzyme, S subunit